MTRFFLTLSAAMLQAAGAFAAILPGGQPLTADMALELVADGLPAATLGRRWELRLTTPGFPLPNRARGDAELSLETFRHDPRSGRFDAGLRVTLAGGETALIGLQGRAEEQVEVPVLTRAVPRGQRIGEDDVASSWLAAAKVDDDTLTEAESLIGQEATRRLAVGRVLRADDIRTPRLVGRDEPVTLVFRRGSIELVASGTALDAGRLGDAVRVVNPTSQRALHGTVVGPRRVQVGAAVEARS